MTDQDWQYIKQAMRLKEVERSVYATKAKNRKENVAEHSWSLAALYWTLREDFAKEFKDIDSERVYEIIQMHDILELHAGDVSTFKHKDVDPGRSADETSAVEQIVQSMSQEKGAEFRNLYLELEKQETIESRIVKGLDRISPAIQRIVTGQGWKDEGISENELDSIQLPKISFSTTLLTLFSYIKNEGKKILIL